MKRAIYYKNLKNSLNALVAAFYQCGLATSFFLLKALIFNTITLYFD